MSEIYNVHPSEALSIGCLVRLISQKPSRPFIRDNLPNLVTQVMYSHQILHDKLLSGGNIIMGPSGRPFKVARPRSGAA